MLSLMLWHNWKCEEVNEIICWAHSRKTKLNLVDLQKQHQRKVVQVFATSLTICSVKNTALDLEGFFNTYFNVLLYYNNSFSLNFKINIWHHKTISWGVSTSEKWDISFSLRSYSFMVLTRSSCYLAFECSKCFWP